MGYFGQNERHCEPDAHLHERQRHAPQHLVDGRRHDDASQKDEYELECLHGFLAIGDRI